MPTASDLLGRSLKAIGALAQGEAIPAGDAADGLLALNGMLGQWSTENLMMYTKVRESFPLVGGTASYTMGTGANFNTTRPQRIENAAIEIDDVEYPIDVLTKDQYAELQLKTLQSNIPCGVYPSGTYPSETLFFYPVPSTAYDVVLYSWKPFSSVALIGDSVTLPPGYDEAIVYNLAVRLAPEYGVGVSIEVAELARQSKANIKRMNFKPILMTSDVPGASRKPYNIYVGE